MMNLIDAGDVISREASRLQSLIDAAAAISAIGSIQQVAAEAEAKRDALRAEVANLTDQLGTLRPQVADAAGKAEALTSDAQARAAKIIVDAVAQAEADTAAAIDTALKAAQGKMQATVDAGNQAAAVAAEQLAAIEAKLAAADTQYSDLLAQLNGRNAERDALELAIAALKSKFA